MNYPTKKLGEVLELNYGKGISKSERDPNGKYPVYGANGVLGHANKFFIDQEAVIVGRKGSAGEVTRVSGKFWPSDVTYYVLGNDQINIDYAFHLFKSLRLQRFAVGVKPGINRNRVYEIEIPLPSLSEQKKIVVKVEKLLAKVDEAKKLRTEAQKSANELLPAELHKIFEEGKKKEWKEKSIEEVTLKITKGTTPKTLGYNYEENGVPFLRAENVDGEVNKSTLTLFISTEVNNILERSKTKNGDVLMTIAGTIGRVGWISDEAPEMNMNQAVAIIRPDKNFVSTKYLTTVLKGVAVQEQVGSGTVKAAIPNFSLGMIKKIKIPVPTFDEQKKIVTRLDSISEKVKQLQEYQKTTAKDLDTLEKSILSEAFSGELV